jgi:hypothetical protein
MGEADVMFYLRIRLRSPGRNDCILRNGRGKMDVRVISYPVIRHKTDGSLCLAIYRGDGLSSLRWPQPHLGIIDNCRNGIG